MSTRRLGLWKLLFAVALLVLAGCDDRRLSKTDGELALSARAADGSSLSRGRDVTWDFGEVYGGRFHESFLEVHNLGRGALELESIEGAEGTPFELTPDETSIAAASSIKIPLKFAAPKVEAPSRFRADVVVRASGAPDELSAAKVHLTATVVPNPCELPEVLDFGIVEVGVEHTLPLVLRNPLSRQVAARIGAVDGRDAAAFKVSGLQDQELVPGGSLEVPITFEPDFVSSFEANLSVRPAPDCEEQTVRLIGEGSESVLVWHPDPVDVGYVPPGLTRTMPLVFQNLGTRDVSVRDLKLTGPEALKTSTNALTVPARGTTTLEVTCAPVALGIFEGRVDFETSLTHQPYAAVDVRCVGGGPDIELTPSSLLDFGKVGFIAGETLRQTRRLTIRNVGTRYSGAPASMNLHLVEPKFRIEPLNGNTTPEEVSITLPNDYDNAAGIPAVGRNWVHATVTLTPKSTGTKAARITVLSDDLDEPELVVTVSADAVAVPSCNYELSPTALEFGLLEPPAKRSFDVSLRNLGTQPEEVCLVSGVGLAPESHPAYRLVGAPTQTVELQPGAMLVLTVEAAPTGAAPTAVQVMNGTLELQVSSPQKPFRQVALTGHVGPACLNFVPSSLDFGNVKVGCGSVERRVEVHNSCGSSVTVNSVSVAAPFFVSAPALSSAVTLAPGDAPVRLNVTFRPQMIGDDAAVVRLSASHADGTVNYLLDVHGRGDSTGQNVDVFTQPPPSPLDLLFVVYNNRTGSVWEIFQYVFDGLPEFFGYLSGVGVSFQVAVVESLDGNPAIPYPWGEMVVGPTHTDRILTPATTQITEKLREKIETPQTLPVVTISGTGSHFLGASLAALTPPRSTGSNAGFLRPDAHLAIVMFESYDNSFKLPFSMYVDELRKVKGVGNEHMVKLHVITRLDPAPIPDCIEAYRTKRNLVAASALMGGVAMEICTDDWMQQMRDIAEAASGFRTTFPLTSAPDFTAGPLTVSINGTPTAATTSSGDTVWSWVPERNAVRFEVSHAPQPGAQIDIGYTALCY